MKLGVIGLVGCRFRMKPYTKKCNKEDCSPHSVWLEVSSLYTYTDTSLFLTIPGASAVDALAASPVS